MNTILLLLAMTGLAVFLSTVFYPLTFSNSAPPPPAPALTFDVFPISNQADSTEIPKFVDIPHGNWDHKRGMQVLDKEAGDLMANAFAAAKTKPNFAGNPIYLGHPDDPAMSNIYTDRRAYGWISNVESLPDRVRLHTDFNTLGNSAVGNKEVRFHSPRWGVQPIPGRSNAYRPCVLRSLGLVNDPNIDVAPLTNEATQLTCPPWVHAAAGLPEGTEDSKTEDHIKGLKVKADAADGYKAAHDDMKTKQDAATAASQAASQKYDDLDRAHRDLKDAHTKLTGGMSNERSAIIALVVDNAISQGRILIKDKDATVTELSNAGDGFLDKVTALTKKAPVLNVGNSKTANLGERKPGSGPSIEELVNEQMKKTGNDYTDSFSAVRRAHPELFANMKQPTLNGVHN